VSDGLVVTFYSYKGGVGRSFALANIGATLARWGHRVLCVDWDLEAPGLDTYFRRWTKMQARRGLIDALESVTQGRDPRWAAYTSSVRLPRTRGVLDVITSGGADGSHYGERVQALDWNRLYEEHDLGARLERARTYWKRHYDFVLIDSRTGISDVAGVTTIQLPDVLVIVLTPNEQSLAGAAEVAAKAVAGRRQLPQARARLPVLPVVSRFDLKVEFKVATEWLLRIENTLRPLYASWVPRHLKIADLLNYTRIPHVPFWSFGESLPVVTDTPRDSDPDSVNYAIHNLAALLAHRLNDAQELLLSRESYLGRAARIPSAKRTTADPELRVFISHGPRGTDTASGVAELLSRSRLQTATSAQLGAGKDWKQALYGMLREANVLIVLLDGAVGSFQLSEIETFVSMSLRQTSFNRIVPVICTDAALKQLPTLLADREFLDGRKLTPVRLAELLVQHIRRQYAEAGTSLGPRFIAPN
jgi:MinD-like ATPase involved in chromosome partitioning or flagellar assembly